MCQAWRFKQAAGIKRPRFFEAGSITSVPTGYTLLMEQPRTSARVSLTALLGTPVTDRQGQLRGKLKDVAVATGPDAGKVAGLVLKTRTGDFIVPSQEVM